MNACKRIAQGFGGQRVRPGNRQGASGAHAPLLAPGTHQVRRRDPFSARPPNPQKQSAGGAQVHRLVLGKFHWTGPLNFIPQAPRRPTAVSQTMCYFFSFKIHFFSLILKFLSGFYWDSIPRSRFSSAIRSASPGAKSSSETWEVSGSNYTGF